MFTPCKSHEFFLELLLVCLTVFIPAGNNKQIHRSWFSFFITALALMTSNY